MTFRIILSVYVNIAEILIQIMVNLQISLERMNTSVF